MPKSHMLRDIDSLCGAVAYLHERLQREAARAVGHSSKTEGTSDGGLVRAKSSSE